MDQKICKLEQEKYELDRKLSQATAYMDITDSVGQGSLVKGMLNIVLTQRLLRCNNLFNRYYS